MNLQQINRSMIKVWRITYLISIIVFASIAVSTYFLHITFDSTMWFFVACGAGAFALYHILGFFIYPAIEYRQWSYAITDDRVYINHGIFFLKSTMIPIARIQHLAINRGPLLRRYGLTTLVIHTASGHFEIKGLTEEIATNLSTSLNQFLDMKLNEEALANENTSEGE